MDFKLVSDYKPTGDQPEAIEQLVSSLRGHSRHNTLLGVTGSGKTFTMANVIAQLNKPTLILSHNKTLAAQLYGEFKNFFPENAVEYFVSYYDYYQPEAYLPTTDTYIEKDLSINEGIEKMRLSTTSSLLSGRNDIVVVSSVSCIYGIGNPEDFHATSITLKVGDIISRNKLLYGLVDALYTRSETEFKQGTFRVKGDTVDIYIAYGDKCYRVVFFDNEIDTVMGSFENGEIVVVHDFDGYPMGKGFINTNSKIRIRMLTRHVDQEIDRTFLQMRVKNAWEYRKTTVDTSSCRVIFGEADFLPGLVVDKYEDVLVVECLALYPTTIHFM